MDDGLLRLQRAYDRDAARRAGTVLEPWRQAVVADFVGRVAARTPSGRAVDLGCGTGQVASELQDAGLDVTALDLSPANAARTRSRGVSAVVADFGRLPFRGGGFDGALAFNTFLHVPRHQLPSLFREVRRVLVPGGLLSVVVWGGVTREGPLADDWLDPPRFFSTMDDADLLATPTPGFDRLEARLLHEHGRRELHPQVLTLAAR